MPILELNEADLAATIAIKQRENLSDPLFHKKAVAVP